MAPDAIVFAMANPSPEVLPEEISGMTAVIATGRSDYPNQINNVLAFPGIFRGALRDVRATTITEGMEVAAGHAIAASISEARAVPGLHRPERVQPGCRAGGRGRGRRRGRGGRRRAPPPRAGRRPDRLSELRFVRGAPRMSPGPSPGFR